jgi:hypothetical protein
MTEQEFTIAAKEKGLQEKEILELISIHKKLAEMALGISFDTLLENAVKAQEEMKDIPEGTVAIDG